MSPTDKQAHFAMAAWGSSGSDLEGVLKLLLRFSEAVDTRNPGEVAALFTSDGLFKPSDQAIRGPHAIEAFYRERFRDPVRRTRHLWSNVIVTAEAGNSASLRAVLSNYAFEPAVSTGDVQMRVGNVSGLCRRDTRGDWLFAEHHYERIYALRLPLADAPQPPTGDSRK